jgi:exonuclease VII small subunit
MKYFSLLLFSLCFGFSLAAKSIAYPSLGAVADKLFKNYDVPESTNDKKLQFAKKPEGWVVTWVDETQFPEVILQEELFWSAKKRKYQKLVLFKSGETVDAQKKIADFLAARAIYECSRDAYYGYIGWDQDVISHFASMDKLSDTLLESLARAYSNYAYSFTDHNFSYVISQPKLTEELRLDSFIHYQQLELGVYNKLRKQNLQYEMIVGNSNTTYSDQVMAFYDYLFLYGKEKIADSYFAEELYDPLILEFAQNSLSSCNDNAILFTWGDNDTFPFEYLQFIKGFRTDVTIINLGLLNIPSTIQQVAKGKGKALPVKFSYDMNRYSNDASEYFQMENIEQFPVSYGKFISKSYMQNIHGEGQSGDYSYYNYPQASIRFPSQLLFSSDYSTLIPDSNLTLSIPKTSLRRSDFAQLDIIMSNLSERPIYYTNCCGELNIGIDNYLYNVGMISRVIPLRSTDDNKLLFGQYAVPGVMYNNLMNVNINWIPGIDKYCGRIFVNNFQVEYILLAMDTALHQYEKSIALLNHCDSLFPNAQWASNPTWAYGVQVYYQCGEFIKGDRIALQMLIDFEKKIQDKKSPPDETEKQQMILAAGIIKDQAMRFHRTDVDEKAISFLLKYKTLE